MGCGASQPAGAPAASKAEAEPAPPAAAPAAPAPPTATDATPAPISTSGAGGAATGEASMPKRAKKATKTRRRRLSMSMMDDEGNEVMQVFPVPKIKKGRARRLSVASASALKATEGATPAADAAEEVANKAKAEAQKRAGFAFMNSGDLGAADDSVDVAVRRIKLEGRSEVLLYDSRHRNVYKLAEPNDFVGKLRADGSIDRGAAEEDDTVGPLEWETFTGDIDTVNDAGQVAESEQAEAEEAEVRSKRTRRRRLSVSIEEGEMVLEVLPTARVNKGRGRRLSMAAAGALSAPKGYDGSKEASEGPAEVTGEADANAAAAAGESEGGEDEDETELAQVEVQKIRLEDGFGEGVVYYYDPAGRNVYELAPPNDYIGKLRADGSIDHGAAEEDDSMGALAWEKYDDAAAQ